MLIGIIPEHLTAYRIHQHLVGQENLLLGKPKQNLMLRTHPIQQQKTQTKVNCNSPHRTFVAF